MAGNFRDELGKAFVAAGEKYEDLFVVTADVSKSTRSIKFKERWPERFCSVGIAEADAVGIAGGIASFGRPVIFTAYGVFATEKPFEQIRNCICYQNLNVTIVATHGGISVGEDGATHQAIEDIAIMRAIPNMKVLVASDPGEVQAALFKAIETPGPVYLRLGRGIGNTLHNNLEMDDYRLGKAEVLRDGKDAAIVAVGIMVERALQAAEKLGEKGLEVAVINLRSVKPIDEDTLVAYAKKTGAMITAEDHTCFGGVYGAVCEVLCAKAPICVERVALQDTFGESGDGEGLLRKYGLTVETIVEKTEKAIERRGER